MLADRSRCGLMQGINSTGHVQSVTQSCVPVNDAPVSTGRSSVRRFARRAAAAAVLGGALILGACSSGDDTRTLIIEQDAPALASFGGPAGTDPTGGDGSSSLKALAFDARITDPDGTEGVLIGYLLTADFPDATGEGQTEKRIGTLVYTFGTSELIVSGGTSYPASEAEMQAGEAQVRAVVGGTGDYLGARGEVVTVRNTDGTYTHTFTLVD